MSSIACRRSSCQNRTAGTETNPVPAATLTHKLVPHQVSLEAWVETLSFRDIGVVIEKYAVFFDGMKMLGVADLETRMEGCRLSTGIRNSTASAPAIRSS